MRAIVFTLQDRLFALPLEEVREVARPQPFSEVPRAPRALLGAISLRGRVLAVLAPEVLFGLSALPCPGDGSAERFVVLDFGTSALALRVARVDSIQELTLLGDDGEEAGGGGREGDATPARLTRGRARTPSGEEIRVLDLDALTDTLDDALRQDQKIFGGLP